MAQTNITFRSVTDFVGSQEGSDIWGFEKGGHEYVISTSDDGVYIYDIIDPDNPALVFYENSSLSSTYWREPKHWGDYVYVVTEAGGGLQIIDISALPGGTITSSDVTYWTGGPRPGGGNYNYSNAHNIFIDENGIGYIVGANGISGAVMIDIDANPTNPPIVGEYNLRYVHDCFVRGDTMWSAEINDGIFSVVDVSNKANPVVLATQSTSRNLSHNIWVSDDGNYCFTTDETGGAYIDSYDVSDLNDIQRLDQYRSPHGSNTIPHNVFIKDNFAYISYYNDGLIMLDVTHPQLMIEAAHYDTEPSYSGGQAGGFFGAWGVYPYFSSGNIAVNDILRGMYVLTPDYIGACFLEGYVTDANTGLPIAGASVQISGMSSANVTTDVNGYYLTGFMPNGNYTVTYSASGYPSDTRSVNFQNGVTLQENVPLVSVPTNPFTLTGQVQIQSSGIAVPNAEVIIDDGTNTYTTTANGAGNFSIPLPDAGNFDIIAGSWGYITTELTNQSLSTSSNTVVVQLQEGYYDDFIFDFGWTTSGNASTGDWVLDVPLGTSFNTLNDSNPGSDVTGDFGTQAYVTGNAGGGAGDDDIDGGIVVLTSPVFDLSGYSDGEISYYRWFFNSGGNTTPDDDLVVKLTNGTNTVVVETITDSDPMSSWELATIQIANFLPPSANMQLIVEARDEGNGHLVEGGIDQFEVTNLITTSTAFTLNGQVNAQVGGAGVGGAEVVISDGTTTYTATANGAGSFSIPLPNSGTFDLIAGQWGYITNQVSNQSLSASNNNLTIQLSEGYYDDFIFDFNWTTSSVASGGTVDGLWVRDVPFGTIQSGNTSNPSLDVTSDFGDECYVTGNAANSNPDNDDVENGTVILTSPIFDLSGYRDADINFYRWFFNNGGDDEMIIKITNGSATAIVETISTGDPFESTWQYTSFQVADYVTPTNNMQLIVEATDNVTSSSAHIMEAGIDEFSVDNLVAAMPFTLNVNVETMVGNTAIGGAEVIVTDGNNTYTATTNASGSFALPLPDSGTFDVIAGQWGYITNALYGQNLNSGNNTITVQLSEGYYDDFIFNFGWASTSPFGVDGAWVKDIPFGTTVGANPANPGMDIAGDFGDECFVTGNANSTNPDDDDVENGTVVLTSPAFDLSGYSDATVSFYRWFFNNGGDDEMVIKISNGSSTAVVETISTGDPFESTWHNTSFQIADYVPPTNNMRLIVEASDGVTSATDHIMEGGIDLFTVSNLITASPFTLTGQVQTLSGGNPIANAEVVVQDGSNTYLATTNGSGTFSIPIPDSGTFDVIAGQWGYVTNAAYGQSFDQINNTITIDLDEGYYDDFIFDFGWTASSQSNGGTVDGLWVKDLPFGTTVGASDSNPGVDIAGDFGDECYVTGNAANSNPDDDDVENGSVILTSPVFDLSAYIDGEISYYRWFFNNGGDDEMIVKLTNGNTTAIVETIDNSDPNTSSWKQTTIQIATYMTPTANMQLIVEVNDGVTSTTANIAEGGIDLFRVDNLVTATPFTLTGQVQTLSGGNPVANAEVVVQSNGSNYTATTNGSGTFAIPLPNSGTFDVIAGQWGYITNAVYNQTFDPINNTITVDLAEGYYDDFIFDFGWSPTSQSNGGTIDGDWIKAVPFGTTVGASPSNPGVDIAGDFGDECYVTGNAANSNPDDDDVENGSVILTSPVFDLTGYVDGEVSYYRWFFNNGGDDEMIVKLTNGNTTAIVETIDNSDPNTSSWQQNTIQIANYMTPTATMQLIVEVNDGVTSSTADIAEGGIDLFQVQNLVAAVPFTLTGLVDETATANVIAGATIIIDDGSNIYNLTSDLLGNFTLPLPNSGTFDIYAGKWGYITQVLTNQSLDINNNTVTISLPEGYYDDFLFDFGWVNSGSGGASDGAWERGEPIGTTFNSSPAQTDLDVGTDIGDLCFVTGNDIVTNANDDDVDGGTWTLTSPIFDLTGTDAMVSYYRWFFTDGMDANDEMVISISNGTDVVAVETVNSSDANQSVWMYNIFRVSDYVIPTATMQLIVTATDDMTDHIVEAGIDQFEVMGTNLPTTTTLQATAMLEGPYNPATGEMTTILQEEGLLPLAQPYTTAPWNYSGTESIATAADLPAGTVDWVLLELRSASDTSIVDRRAAFLLKDGTIVDTDGNINITFFNAIINGNYFLAVRHRNHLDILSDNPLQFPVTTPYNCTDAANIEQGSSLTKDLGGGLRALYAGDFDASAFLTVTDYNYYQGQSAFINQYVGSDANLDRVVTVADFNLYQPNVGVIGLQIFR